MSSLTWGDNCAIQESGRAEYSTRDLSQNLFTLLSLAPELCRKRILDLAAYQYFDGDFSHGIIPLIERGSRSGHSDHQLWLPYLVSQYCRETDDTGILSEMVPYHDRGEARLLEHCVRAVEFVLGRKSARGLPLILNGDWNEALDHLGREGKGESIWLAMFLVYVMKRFIVLFNDSSTQQIKEKFMREIENLTTVINTCAWDGEWYHRAFSDDGRPVGSERNEKGQIFLLPQAWSVISGTAPRERGKKALESVLKHLDSPEGTLSMYPPYVQPDQSIGIITRYAPGKRENGGILKTAAIWRIMAECLYGNGNKAYKLLKKHMNAVCSAADQYRFKAEPYFESEYIDGIESSECGMGSLTYRGCSASWIFRLIHDWICGIRLEQRGMKIDPSLPGDWDRLVIKKAYRGAFYEITVENPHHLQKGVGTMYVDDSEFTGSFIPIFGDGMIHRVRVIIGKEIEPQPTYDTAVVESVPETPQEEPQEEPQTEPQTELPLAQDKEGEETAETYEQEMSAAPGAAEQEPLAAAAEGADDAEPLSATGEEGGEDASQAEDEGKSV